MIDVFGSTGYIGGRFCELYPESVIRVPRESRKVASSDVLYLSSTNSNYNVYEDLHVDIDTNLNVLMDVLSSCREQGSTINYISSWFVYGNTKLPAEENNICDPRGFYSITKKCAEDLLISYCRTFDVSYRIMRLSNVYGRFDPSSSAKKNALHFLMYHMIENKEINLYHGGDFRREYTHVDDICAGIDFVMTNGGLNQIYNIGTGVPTSFRDLMEFSKKCFGSSSNLLPVDPSAFHDIVQVRDMCMDVTKLNDLGFHTKINVYDGITELCDWMQKEWSERK